MNKRDVLQLKITYTIHRLSNISNIFFLAPPSMLTTLSPFQCLKTEFPKGTWKTGMIRIPSV